MNVDGIPLNDLLPSLLNTVYYWMLPLYAAVLSCFLSGVLLTTFMNAIRAIAGYQEEADKESDEPDTREPLTFEGFPRLLVITLKVLQMFSAVVFGVFDAGFKLFGAVYDAILFSLAVVAIAVPIGIYLVVCINLVTFQLPVSIQVAVASGYGSVFVLIAVLMKAYRWIDAKMLTFWLSINRYIYRTIDGVIPPNSPSLTKAERKAFRTWRTNGHQAESRKVVWYYGSASACLLLALPAGLVVSPIAGPGLFLVFFICISAFARLAYLGSTLHNMLYSTWADTGKPGYDPEADSHRILNKDQMRAFGLWFKENFRLNHRGAVLAVAALILLAGIGVPVLLVLFGALMTSSWVLITYIAWMRSKWIKLGMPGYLPDSTTPPPAISIPVTAS